MNQNIYMPLNDEATSLVLEILKENNIPYVEDEAYHRYFPEKIKICLTEENYQRLHDRIRVSVNKKFGHGKRN